MIESLKKIRPSNWKKHRASSLWMIVDWSGEYFVQNKELIPPQVGGCCVYTDGDKPQDTELSHYSVKVQSITPMELISTGLRPNAWRPIQEIGQCDAILFPSRNNKGDALLLVETKYSKSDEGWKEYKEHALKQITDTITQLSTRSCPIDERNLFGLISCPLLSPIGASVFSVTELMENYETHRVQIHMGNTATFEDEQTISFT